MTSMSDATFSKRAWRLIQRKPASIVLVRGASTLLDAQTVRIEMSNAQVEKQGGSGAVAVMRDAVVFGVRGHETIADTDIKRNDRFEYKNREYRVLDINDVVGGVQAHCEVIS